ncbi:diguanylate cyclase domain-containing protein [Paraferrimonas haliotis]|uniref:Sensor domain-containing diguanylate cyclase n=1 Tax=Paraferrimonas haliotis TaxID=2013866 RepID=A0AA37TWP9_9GAMM|nr:diguanylate cyclase [Paraferrimonas haliotis]GLS84190.1 sensor domain-containing diguanylate cyclase [Paraferrimonas haliotis]
MKSPIRIIKQYIVPFRVAFIVALGVFIANSFLITVSAERKQEIVEQEVSYRLSDVRARLEQSINASVFLTQGIDALIATQHNLNESQFINIAKAILDREPGIRNISLAPQNVVRYVYPKQGNEAVIGVDLEAIEHQRKAVLAAKESNDIVVAGPIALIQGGEGIISRKPIFQEQQGSLNYWGLVSIVIDTEQLYQQAQLQSAERNLNIAIRGVDGQGSSGAVFYGNPDIFKHNPQLLSVALPSGSWVLAAIPVEGWERATQLHWAFYFGNTIISLIMASVSFFAAASYEKANQLARQDSLTGLPNRLSFDETLEQALDYCHRYQTRGGLIVFDLDKFKPINDQFGHDVGDQVLTVIAKRLSALLRRNDTICRIGGDEFIVLLPNVSADESLERVCEKLIESLCLPITIDGNELQIGVSVGACYFPCAERTNRQLIARADRAMYRAKNAGGNRFEIEFDC